MESEGDAPLNLSMKSSGDSKAVNSGTNSLQSLTSITAALGQNKPNDRNCKYLKMFDFFNICQKLQENSYIIGLNDTSSSARRKSNQKNRLQASSNQEDTSGAGSYRNFSEMLKSAADEADFSSQFC